MIVYVVSGSPASIASCLQGTGVGRDAWMELRTTTRDLAFRAGIQRSVLRAQCARIGLQRVEHFITLVRWLAFEFLTGTREMSAGRARVVVGISDPSNFRRQLGRLGYYGHAQRPDGNMLSARNR